MKGYKVIQFIPGLPLGTLMKKEDVWVRAMDDNWTNICISEKVVKKYEGYFEPVEICEKCKESK